MSSTRLQGKVLADVSGEPMIMRQIARVRKANSLGRLVVATSNHGSDDPLVELLIAQGVEVFRGELEDVAARFLKVIENLDADHVVRLTADCPLIDPDVIDLVVERHLSAKPSYSSNTIKRTFPKGLDVEVFSAPSFRDLCSQTLTADEKEHVTLGFHNRPERFALQSVQQEHDFSHHRWTVDYQKDLDFVRRVYERFEKRDFDFKSEEIIASGMKNPLAKTIADN